MKKLLLAAVAVASVPNMRPSGRSRLRQKTRCSAMRKSNFVLAAAAILAASAASSAARGDALPKEVLGSWCPDTDDGSHTSYKRGKCETPTRG